MINAWLSSPPWLIIAVLLALFGLYAALLHGISFGAPWRQRMLQYNGLVAPFFSGIAVLFALLTGFVASDVWERNKLASRSILSERDSLLNVYYLSVSSHSDMGGIRAAERDYINYVVSEEWPLMGDQERSRNAGAALGVLLSRVADPKVAAEAGGAVQDALLQSVIKIRSARYDRIAISGDHSDVLKWASVLMLALLTMTALALEHLDRPRVQVTALLLYSLAAVAALGPVAVRERPFAGAFGLPSTPLSDVLAIMARGIAPVPPPG